MEEKKSGSYLSPRTYDSLKWIAQIALPAVGTLYFALAGLWNLPSANEVVGTILAVDTFMGVLLGLSTAQYNNSPASHEGVLQVTPTPEGNRFIFKVNDDPHDVVEAGKKNFVFKVNKTPAMDHTPLDLPPVEMPDED